MFRKLMGFVGYHIKLENFIELNSIAYMICYVNLLINDLSRRTKGGTSVPRHLHMLMVLYAASFQGLGIFQ